MFGLNQEEKDKLNDIHIKIGQVDYFFQNYEKFVEVGKDCQQILSKFSNIENKMQQSKEDISKLNENFQKYQTFIWNFEKCLKECRDMKMDFDERFKKLEESEKRSQDLLDNFVKLEKKLVKFMKEARHERKEKESYQVQICGEAPQGGHEDVPKRKRGRQKAIKKA